jgi:hypothetical protein
LTETHRPDRSVLLLPRPVTARNGKELMNIFAAVTDVLRNTNTGADSLSCEGQNGLPY